MSQSNYIWIDEAQDLSGIDLHERWLKGERGGQQLNLEGESFENLPLHCFNFSKAVLVNCNFADAEVQHCDFSHADLTRSDFTGAILVYADFSGANLTNATFDFPIHQFEYKGNHGHTYGTFFRYQGVYEQMYRWMSENLIQDKKELKAVREFLEPLIK